MKLKRIVARRENSSSCPLEGYRDNTIQEAVEYGVACLYEIRIPDGHRPELPNT